MRWTTGMGVAALLAWTSAPLAAQDRPGLASEERPAVPTAAAGMAQDTVRPDTMWTSRLRLDGRLIADLPVDDADGLLRLFPGFATTARGGRMYRADATWIGTYVDGVPFRSLIGSGAAVTPPLNALSSVSLLRGGLPASLRGAAAVEYTTIAGGDSWTADGRVLSDALAPGSWDQYNARFRLNAGGPVPGIAGLRIAVAGEAAGQRFTQLPEGGPGVYLPSGVDTVFRMLRTGGDSVDVVVPEYVPWEYGQLPLGNSDTKDVVTALTFERGAARFGLRYYRNTSQRVMRATEHLYNPDAWRGADDIAQIVSLTAQQPLPWGVTGSAVVSHQRFDNTYGVLDPAWATANAHPRFGVSTGPPAFVADRADYPLTEPILLAARSGVLPLNIYRFTTVGDLVPMRQGVAGISTSMRLNPYGVRTGLPTSGLGGSTEPVGTWSTERRWYGRVQVARQFGIARLELGGETDRVSTESLSVPLADGQITARREGLNMHAVFAQGHAVIDDVDIHAGVRIDGHTGDAMLPLTPGFVTSLPDSLLGDAYRIAPGDGPWEQRLQRVVDCGGASTAAARVNQATGALVCRNNFLPLASHTTVSPRLTVAYNGDSRFVPRASYGVYAQPGGLLGASRDLAFTSSITPHPRDTKPVRERLAELGVRIATTRGSWVDVEFFQLDVNNPIVYRRQSYVNPVTSAPILLVAAMNGENQSTLGIELTAQQRLTTWAGVFGSVTMTDTRVKGSSVDLPSPSDPVRAAGIAWLDLSGAGSALRDVTVHATASYAGGARYTRLRNVGDGYLVGQLASGAGGGTADEEFLASRLPSRKQFDLRIAKAFHVAGARTSLIADLRNPFGIENVHTVFAETGTLENPNYRYRQIENALGVYLGGFPQDVVIDDITNELALNRHMLRRAEARFGNGDGIYTVEEMTAAVSSYLDLMNGTQYMRDSRRELRLGVQVTF